jgi:hypothetical protein
MVQQSYDVILSGAIRVVCESRSRRTPMDSALPQPPQPFQPRNLFIRSFGHESAPEGIAL